MDKSKNNENKNITNNISNNLFGNKWMRNYSTFDRLANFGFDMYNKYSINNSLTSFINDYQIKNHWFTNYELPFSAISKATKLWEETYKLNSNFSELINYTHNFQNFLINNDNFMQISNAVKALQDSFVIRDYFKEFSAQQEAISKMFTSNAIRDLAIYQQQFIEKLENFNIEEENPQEFIEDITQNNFEEQFEVIKTETNSKVKEYLKQNHLMILSIVIPIIFFIWQNCHNSVSEQNEKIISLLEQNQKTQKELLDVNKKILSEEELQTELINMQTELLKEMIADVKTNIAKQNKGE